MGLLAVSEGQRKCTCPRARVPVHAQQKCSRSAFPGRLQPCYVIHWKWEHFNKSFHSRKIWVLLENTQS